MKRTGLIALLGITAFVSVYAIKAKDNFFEISKNLEIFATLYRELNMFYVDETQPGDLMKTGIDAMLESLDPYTNYITESDIEDFRFMTTGQYGGIGSLIRSADDGIYISEPYKGFPAQVAGLKAGDRILKIDGKEIDGKDQEEISAMLKGQSGTALTVTVKRFDEIMEVPLTRQEIKIPDVPYYGMIDDEVGYIRLTSFTRSASKEVKAAFAELKERHGMQKLVFDLRGNGGGLLMEAVNIVNIFVPKGQEVVKTKGRVSDWERSHVTLNEPVDLNIPLVILVDQGSASASEIVAGTIQDLDRGVVIGNRTFGKGLVQETRNLQYNSRLKLTVAKYYTPSGRCIQKLDYSHRGSDGNVEEVPDSLLKPFETRNGRKVMDGRGIEPDLTIENRDFPQVLASLLNENLFFFFATGYAAQKESIDSAKTFHLTDEEYAEFVRYLDGKDYQYTTDTEEDLKGLMETAKKEKYFALAEAEFRLLEDKLSQKKNKDLYLFREDIQLVLENEIVSRYYFQRGRIEATLASDVAIDEAIRVFQDMANYKGILRPA
jgi:carboxyl-terminal processing protease